MGSGGIVGRALRTRWCRAAAVLGACALSVQSARLPLLAWASAATCCCPHQGADDACGCPVCAHRRDLESGRPVLETCGAGGQDVSIAVPGAALLPARIVALPPRPPPPAVLLVAAKAPAPPLDVPTPPPLARG